MYLPPQFNAEDRAHACELMRSHPFASLIGIDDAGLPFVSHLPLHLEEPEEQGGPLVLPGHCARPNPHWRYLLARPQVLARWMDRLGLGPAAEGPGGAA